MIRTFNSSPAGKEHTSYEFIHHDMLLRAYDDLGRNLDRLRLEIKVKYADMKQDKTRCIYYVELIQNLERQFARMVVEGLNGGAIEIIKTAEVTVEERSVA